MSQRPSASRPTSRSPTDGQRITLPPVQLQDEVQRRGGPHGVAYDRRPEPRFQIPSPSQHVKGISVPLDGSIPPSFAGERYPTTSRPLGVHTMLNPTTSDVGVTSSPRPGETQSVNTSVAPSPYIMPPLSAQPHSSQRSDVTSPSNEAFNATFSRGRRILTPRSPSRVPSVGRVGKSQGAGEQKPVFLGIERGRILRTEPGSESLEHGPPLSEPPLRHQQPFFQPSTPAQPVQGPRHGPPQKPHSQSTSPSTTYSSYSQPSQTSPVPLYQNNPPPTSTSYFPNPGFGPSGHVGGPGGGITQIGTEGPYRPSNMSSSSGPSQSSSNYQLMTFSSSLGTYQVPVDASSASRLADEKRARNAGASARFRQRRKEKEREASTQIGRLETQTRKLEERNSALEEEKKRLERNLGLLEEERDFYRSERDRYRGLVVGTTGDRELGNGPPSPRTTRSSASASGTFSTSNTLYRQSPTMSETPGIAERAPRRRRTDVQGDFASLPPSQGPVHPQSFRPSSEHGATVSSTLPPLRMENVSAASNVKAQTTSTSNTPTTPGSFDHYSSQRKWTGGLPPPPPPSGPQDRR